MGRTSPNPPVAACLLKANGDLISAGTCKAGKSHAERALYEKISNPGLHDLYVTLEPCTHYGKTPPCSTLIQEKMPRSLTFGHLDPNPLVAQNTFSYRGIQLYQEDSLAIASMPFLRGFFQRIKKKSPG